MKTPLRYQFTEFDCGSVSLLNALAFLFEREEIPAELIKTISTYTLDCYDNSGNLGAKGTSREAVQFISRFFDNYSKTKDFKIKTEYLEKNKVSLKAIKECVNNGGCVNLRTYQICEHYVLITKIDEKNVYIFDPYFKDKNAYNNTREIEIDYEHPFEYNRIVSLNRLKSSTTKEFSLGPIEKREALLIYKK